MAKVITGKVRLSSGREVRFEITVNDDESFDCQFSIEATSTNLPKPEEIQEVQHVVAALMGRDPDDWTTTSPLTFIPIGSTKN